MEGQRFLRAGRGLGRGLMRGGFPFRGRGLPIDGIRPGAPRPGMLRPGPPPLFPRGLHGPRGPMRPMGPNGPMGMLGRPPIPPPGGLGPRGMMPRPPGMGLRSLVPHAMDDDNYDSDDEIDSLMPDGGGGPVRISGMGGMKGSPSKGMRGGTGQRRGRGRPGAQRGTMRGSMQARGDASMGGGQSDFNHEENLQADQNLKSAPSQRGTRGKRGGNQGMRGDGNQGGSQITSRAPAGRPPAQSSAQSTHPSNSNSVQANSMRGNRGNISQRGSGPMGRGGMDHNVRAGAPPPLLGNRGGMMGGQPPMTGVQPPQQFPPVGMLPPNYGMGPTPITGPYGGSGVPPAFNNSSLPPSSIKRTSGVNNQPQANKRIRYDAPTSTNGVQPFQPTPQANMHPEQYMDYGIGGANNSHGNQRPRYDSTVPDGYPHYHGSSVSTYPPYEQLPVGDMYGVPPGVQPASLYGNTTGYEPPMLNSTAYGQGNVTGQYSSSTMSYDGSGYMNPYPSGFEVQPTVDYSQAPLASTDNPYSYAKQATGTGATTTEGYSYPTTSAYPAPVASYEEYTTGGYIDPAYTATTQDPSYGQPSTYTGGYTY